MEPAYWTNTFSTAQLRTFVRLCGAPAEGTPAQLGTRLATHPRCAAVRAVADGVLTAATQARLEALPLGTLVTALRGLGLEVSPPSATSAALVQRLKWTQRGATAGAVLGLLIFGADVASSDDLDYQNWVQRLVEPLAGATLYGAILGRAADWVAPTKVAVDLVARSTQ